MRIQIIEHACQDVLASISTNKTVYKEKKANRAVNSFKDNIVQNLINQILTSISTKTP